MAEQERLTVEQYRQLVTAAAGTVAPKSRRSFGARKARTVKDERDDTLMMRLLRLMAKRAPSARLRLKPEERLAIEFADALRALTIEGRLKCVWTHPANEVAGQQSRQAQIRYAIAKAMGLIDGTPDYLFLSADGSCALEAKVGNNGQQPNQVDFQAWCESLDVPYATFTGVEEGLALLRGWGMIRGPAVETENE